MLLRVLSSALDTALSAAGITVASTASGDLTLTFDTGGDRTDEASTINFTTNPSTGFDAGTATVTTQGVDSYRSEHHLWTFRQMPQPELSLLHLVLPT